MVDMARMLHGLLAELIFGNMGAEIPTYVRSDKSDAVYHVVSVNTAAGEKTPEWTDRVIEGTREEQLAKRWFYSW